MSDEKKPFAVVDEDAEIIRVAGIDVSHGVRRSDVTDINAAVECERREAAVKALRQAAHDILREPASSRRNAFSWISERAERIERGEQ